MTQTARQASITVNATATLLCTPSAERQFFYVRNTSPAAQVLTLFFGNRQTITAGAGLSLGVGYAYLEDSAGDFDNWKGEIWAIGDAVGTACVVVER